MKTQNNTLKDIKSGKYKDQYLIYARKSTDDGENQKNSISFQKTECKSHAALFDLPVANIDVTGLMKAGYIAEKHSAFKQGEEFDITEDGQMRLKIERPKFQKLLFFLSNRYFKGVIIYCPDRAQRNDTDEVAIKKLISQGIDIRYVTTAYDTTSSGTLHRDIDGMFAKHHSRVTSEKVRETTKKLRREGKCTYRARIGYLNEGNPDWKPFDPKRAPIIRDSFKMYATGQWTYHSLARWCNEQGLTTVPMKRKRTKTEMLADEEDEVRVQRVSRPITFIAVSRWLKCPFYLGMVLDEDGQWQKSTAHEALIDQETFDQVQQVRKRQTVSIQYSQKLDYPFRGMLRCGSCARAFCPYEKKGVTYYGLRCREGCQNATKSLNLPYVEAQIERSLDDMIFTDEEVKRLDSRVRNEVGQLEEQQQKKQMQSERKGKAICEKLYFLRSQKLNLLSSGTYTSDEYLAEGKALNADLADLQSEKQISATEIRDTVEDVVKVSELLKTLCFYWKFMKTTEKESICRILFSELHVWGKTLTFKAETSFASFKMQMLSPCDGTDWLSELNQCGPYVKSARVQLDALVNAVSVSVSDTQSK